MTLQQFINLCADEDILLDIYDDETSNKIKRVWKSELDYSLQEIYTEKEVQSYNHILDGNNLVIEIYVK